jgi:DNA-binding XRE family transcriptional regulator
MTTNPVMVRAARALLGWSQTDLAHAAGLKLQTIARFEIGEQTPLLTTMSHMIAALEAAGVRFTETGVNLGSARQ